MALTKAELDAVRASVGRKCQRCPAAEYIRANGSSSLHVHHIVEYRNGGTDARENLEVLCPKCHRRETCDRVPPLPQEKRRSKRVVVGLTPEEYDRLELLKLAMGCGSKSSALLECFEEQWARLRKSGSLAHAKQIYCKPAPTPSEEHPR